MYWYKFTGRSPGEPPMTEYKRYKYQLSAGDERTEMLEWCTQKGYHELQARIEFVDPLPKAVFQEKLMEAELRLENAQAELDALRAEEQRYR